MTRPTRCIFCGGPADSKEHLLRKKWQEYFGGDAQGFADVHTYGDPKGGPPHIQKSEYVSVPFDRQVRAVCIPCNTGWMNDLENEVEPILLRLFEGGPSLLTSSDLEFVTLWAAKTTFVAEAMDRSPSASMDEQRHAVRLGMPPTRFNAFLLPLQANWSHRVRSTPWYLSHNPDRGVIRFMTIHVRQIQLFTITAQDELAESLSLDLQSIYRRLGSPTWPPTELKWPSHVPLPVESVQVMHDLMALAAPATFIRRFAVGDSVP